MKQSKWIAAALAALLSPAALAQTAPQQPDPLDANATVPAPAYVSAFAGYVPGAAAEGQPQPDKGWRAANDKVAKSDAHAGHEPSPQTAKEAPPADHSKHSGH